MPYLLDFMRIQVDDLPSLEAKEVQAAGGSATHNAGALWPLQKTLQLGDVPGIYLQQCVEYYRTRFGISTAMHSD